QSESRTYLVTFLYPTRLASDARWRAGVRLTLGPLILLRHKLQRKRPFKLRRERCFDFAPQHGQRDRMAASLTVRRRRMVAIEFGTWRSGRSGGASGSITFGKGKFREENFGN